MMLKPFTEKVVTKEPPTEALPLVSRQEQKQANFTEIQDSPSGITSVLASVGLVTREDEDAEKDLNYIQKVFKRNNAGLNDAARRVGELIDSSKEEIQLRATEIALKVFGVYSNEDKKRSGDVTIVIQANGSDNKNLVNLVMPKVD